MLSKVQKDGATLQDHLMTHWARSGQKSELLELPELPDCAGYIWDWYMELHAERDIDEVKGPRPITSSEIVFWSQLQSIQLSPFEARALKAIDKTFLYPKTKEGDNNE